MKSSESGPLAIIATRIFEPEASAAAYRLAHLARALERRGYRVKVLTSRAPDAHSSTPQIRRWPVLRDRSGSVRGYLQYASFDGPLLLRLLFGRKPAIVIAEPPPTTGLVTRIACAIRRVPYVYYSADVTSAAVTNIGVSRVIIRAVTAMERWVLAGAAGVLAVSEGVQSELEGLGTDPAKITMVGTGIDTQRFAAAGSKEDVSYPYFVYAGTMSEFQGAQIFVEAFRHIAATHDGVRLMMFGGGTDLSRIREISAPLGDRVQFPGFVSSDAVARWLRGATAGLASVRPGQGYDFAIPTKTLASVACGTPVIFAGVGPLRPLITERRLGWSVDWNATQVANAMSEALTTPSPLDGSGVGWLVENFSLRSVADRAAQAVHRTVQDQQ